MKERVVIRLSVPDIAYLDAEVEARDWTRSQYISHLIENKRCQNGAQTVPKRCRNGARNGTKSSRRRSTRGKKNKESPLVSPPGELFLSSFASLFKAKPEFDCQEFHEAWKDFVEMRADKKTKPAAVTHIAAKRIANQFMQQDFSAVVSALDKSVIGQYSGIFYDQSFVSPRLNDEWEGVSSYITRPPT